MISLFVDTATDFGVVALCKNGCVLYKKEFTSAFANSKMLLPSIDALFQEAHLEPKDLGYIACGKGPGSYTGIRVSVAFAKGVSFALGIPLVAVSSLRGFVPDKEYRGAFIAAIDAKIGGIYAVLGEVSDHGVVYHGEDMLVTPAQFEKMQENIASITTPQKSALEKRFAHIANKIYERAPCAAECARLAHASYLAGQSVHTGSVDIAYLRKTQAEIEKGT